MGSEAGEHTPTSSCSPGWASVRTGRVVPPGRKARQTLLQLHIEKGGDGPRCRAGVEATCGRTEGRRPGTGLGQAAEPQFKSEVLKPICLACRSQASAEASTRDKTLKKQSQRAQLGPAGKLLPRRKTHFSVKAEVLNSQERGIKNQEETSGDWLQGTRVWVSPQRCR